MGSIEETLYGNFMSELGEARSFGYKHEWDLLKGAKRPVRYVGELVERDSLEIFSREKHLVPEFTGFVNTENKKVSTGYFDEEYINFAFIEKGKIRYFQYEFMDNTVKLYFFNENFQLLKGYGGHFQEEGKLSYVHRSSKFKLDDLDIGFNRIGRDKLNIYVSREEKEGIFMSMGIFEDKSDLINEDIFSDYSRFIDFFRGEAATIYSKKYFEKEFKFEEALKLIGE